MSDTLRGVDMDIEVLRADLKTRQEAVAKEYNDLVTQEQALAQRKRSLIEEIHKLNGETRMLNKLNGDKPKE